jgi:hypothetical protein
LIKKIGKVTARYLLSALQQLVDSPLLAQEEDPRSR